MKKINLGNGQLQASAVTLGCMRLWKLGLKEAEQLIQTALENGIDFFDHADIYGNGKSEEVFSKAIGMRPEIREKFILQSKCGIRNVDTPEVYFDFSKEHILEAVDGILKRLNVDYLDILLLHRPDSLMEPEEIAEALAKLHSSGKVRNFGVSNQTPMMIELLQKYVGQKFIVNQLQLSLAFTGMIDSGFNVNMKLNSSIDRDGGILEYCRLKDITIQAWSPFQYGYFEGVFLNSEKYKELNKHIQVLCEKYNVPDTAIATAWILRHPAKMQIIPGTTNAARLTDICKGANIELTKEEWYDLYKAAGNPLP